jgi:hypothetical protein
MALTQCLWGLMLVLIVIEKEGFLMRSFIILLTLRRSLWIDTTSLPMQTCVKMICMIYFSIDLRACMYLKH